MQWNQQHQGVIQCLLPMASMKGLNLKRKIGDGNRDRREELIFCSRSQLLPLSNISELIQCVSSTALELCHVSHILPFQWNKGCAGYQVQQATLTPKPHSDTSHPDDIPTHVHRQSFNTEKVWLCLSGKGMFVPLEDSYRTTHHGLAQLLFESWYKSQFVKDKWTELWHQLWSFGCGAEMGY